MRHPPITALRQEDTHRLIPSRHLPASDSVLTRVADDDEHLNGIFELDDATNERLLAERIGAAASGRTNCWPPCRWPR